MTDIHSYPMPEINYIILNNHVYPLPDLSFIPILIASAILWLILISLIYENREYIDRALHRQISEYDSNLTVVILCFTILFIPTYILAAPVINMWDRWLEDTYGYCERFLTNDYIRDVIVTGLNASFCLFCGLFVWLMLNIAHTICLAIDQIRGDIE